MQMTSPAVPMVTSYFGRKVSDNNYGSGDSGMWLSLPLGATEEMIAEAVAQGEAQIKASKPIVLARLNQKEDAA